MSIPKITVLMSVYNGKAFLAEAISSILTPNFRTLNFSSLMMVRANLWITWSSRSATNESGFIDTENIGLTRSLNKGLMLARGEYVARMDADDVSLPSRLEAQADALDGDESLDIVEASLT